LTCVSAPLTTHRLDIERMTLIQDRVVKEQVAVLIRASVAVDIVPDP
jgi:hypothetical protein